MLILLLLLLWHRIEQLILHIEFQDAVKIHSINIVAPVGGNKYARLFVFAH